MSLLKQAIEAVGTKEGSLSSEAVASNGTSIEREYGWFIRLTDVAIKRIIDSLDDLQYTIIIESNIGKTKDSSSRARLYVNNGITTGEVTTKLWGDDIQEKTELNNTVAVSTVQSIMRLAGKAISRIRVDFPFRDADGNKVIRDNGEEMIWELDLYLPTINTDGEPEVIYEWAKLDLEVDSLDIDDISKLIPFPYEELFLTNSKEPTHRAQANHLYNNVYPISL